jgi:nitrogen fixation/metabolism regulation signal transduction histidine kinase
MTKVNQLLEKALSTQSEEEAISCLRLARKRHTGEAVDVRSSAAEQSKELYWREQAEKYFRIAQGYDKQAAVGRRLAAEYLDKYMEESKRSQKLHSENSVLRLNVNLWRGLSAVLFGLMIVAALI